MLYVREQSSLYGCLKSAIINDDKLVGDLEAHGFEIKPYDPCVSNKTVEHKKLTKTWHVDDLKCRTLTGKSYQTQSYGWNIYTVRCMVPAGSSMNT